MTYAEAARLLFVVLGLVFTAFAMFSALLLAAGFAAQHLLADCLVGMAASLIGAWTSRFMQ